VQENDAAEEERKGGDEKELASEVDRKNPAEPENPDIESQVRKGFPVRQKIQRKCGSVIVSQQYGRAG
jgi:hypothetical protein